MVGPIVADACVGPLVSEEISCGNAASSTRKSRVRRVPARVMADFGSHEIRRLPIVRRMVRVSAGPRRDGHAAAEVHSTRWLAAGT
jgi:hypothetical protein